jgi:hypothetical protein
MWLELARQYGPLVGLRVNRDLVVLVSGHDAVKHVLNRDDCNGRPDGFFFRMRTFNKVQGKNLHLALKYNILPAQIMKQFFFVRFVLLYF